MDSKTFLMLTGLIVALLAAQATAQTPMAAMPAWQIVTSGNDGAAAFKMNTATGESYFCYRQNCFRSQQQ